MNKWKAFEKLANILYSVRPGVNTNVFCIVRNSSHSFVKMGIFTEQSCDRLESGLSAQALFFYVYIFRLFKIRVKNNVYYEETQ